MANPPPQSFGLGKLAMTPVNVILLGVMMFLQFAVWGAWFVTLGVYLEKGLGFSGAWIGAIYGTMALGTIFSPMIVGAIADRYFNSEKLMGILHLVGGVLLLILPVVGTNPEAFYAIALLYALLYSPTLALANSITFSHVPNGTVWFPILRTFGTIGWVVVGLFVGFVLPSLIKLPEGTTVDATAYPLYLAGGLSILLGFFSFLLPATPPTGKAGEMLPAIKALGLLKDPSFAIFFGVSFVITIVLAFYYGFTGNYLADSILPKLPGDMRPDSVAPVMAIGQIAEMLILPFLGACLYFLGMKWVLAIGMFAWGLRYLLFAFGSGGEPAAIGPFLVIASLALHGICFDFFFAAGFIHVDNNAPKEVRASGQALFTFLTYGLGMWLGNTISGVIVDKYTLFNEVGGEAKITQAVDSFLKATNQDLKTDDKGVFLHDVANALGGTIASPITEEERDTLQKDLGKDLGNRAARLLEEAHAKALDPKHKSEGVFTTRNWFMVWIIPSLGVFAALAVFLALFREDKKKAQALEQAAV
ncbi:MAG: MFS transporter [Gemmataceae bacterium]|nr:MFS transporter [Gemmataceae bacterium]